MGNKIYIFELNVCDDDKEYKEITYGNKKENAMNRFNEGKEWMKADRRHFPAAHFKEYELNIPCDYCDEGAECEEYDLGDEYALKYSDADFSYYYGIISVRELKTED